MKQIKIILIFIIIFLIYKNCFHKEKLVEGYPDSWRRTGLQPYRFNEAEARQCVDGGCLNSIPREGAYGSDPHTITNRTIEEDKKCRSDCPHWVDGWKWKGHACYKTYCHTGGSVDERGRRDSRPSTPDLYAGMYPVLRNTWDVDLEASGLTPAHRQKIPVGWHKGYAIPTPNPNGPLHMCRIPHGKGSAYQKTCSEAEEIINRPSCLKCVVRGRNISASLSKNGSKWTPADGNPSSLRPYGMRPNRIVKTCGACFEDGSPRFRGNARNSITGCDIGDGDEWINGQLIPTQCGTNNNHDWCNRVIGCTKRIYDPYQAKENEKLRQENNYNRDKAAYERDKQQHRDAKCAVTNNNCRYVPAGGLNWSDSEWGGLNCNHVNSIGGQAGKKFGDKASTACDKCKKPTNEHLHSIEPNASFVNETSPDYIHRDDWDKELPVYGGRTAAEKEWAIACNRGYRGNIKVEKCNSPVTPSRTSTEWPLIGNYPQNNGIKVIEKCEKIDSCTTPTNLQGYTQIDEGDYKEKTYIDDFKVTAKCDVNHFNPDGTMDAKVDKCDSANQPYRLSGCEPTPCGARAIAGSIPDRNQICIPRQNPECGLNGDSEARKGTGCSRFVNRCIGEWVDVDENDINGCKQRCKNNKDVGNPYSLTKKVKVWKQKQDGDVIQAEALMDGGGELVKCRSLEGEDGDPGIEVQRNNQIITLKKGDEILPGDLRIGYKGKYLTKADLNSKNVYGELPNENRTDENIWRYIYCDKADETKCEPININANDEGFLDGERVIFKEIHQDIQKANVCDMNKENCKLVSFSKLKDSQDKDIIPNKCEYTTCSKHCKSEWKPSIVDFDKFIRFTNNGGKLLGYNDGNNKEWGPCARSDNNKCGIGIQAREAVISSPINNGLTWNSDDGNGGKCFLPNSNVKLTELTKNEYRKCRGDKDNTWQPCNKALLSHINESGGIKEMKDDFQLLGSIMITPEENNETIVEGFDNSPAASASCEKSTKRPKQKFWEIDNSRIGMLDAQLDEKERNKDQIIHKINKINQIQIDYVKNDKYRNNKGILVSGLKQTTLLRRIELTFPLLSEISTDIDSNDNQIFTTITSFPNGGSVSKMDWITIFSIRLIYILELLNLKTIERMNEIKELLEKFKNYSPLISKYYYIRDNYQGDVYNISNDSWNLYPIQWMYGGGRRTGINSNNPSEIESHVKSILRSFYKPCRSINELIPIEQYIRFNISLYRYVQDNHSILTDFRKSAISINNSTIIPDKTMCNTDLRHCGFNENIYPDWFAQHIRACENDINQCYINQSNELTIPKSIDDQIKRWKCNLGFKDKPENDECCKLSGNYDIYNKKCKTSTKTIQDTFKSEMVDTNNKSLLYGEKQKNLSINNIDKNTIKGLNGELYRMNQKCNVLTKDQCNNNEFCEFKGEKCMFKPKELLEDKYKIGTSVIHKIHKPSGELWNEWLYKLQNGGTSDPENYKDFQPIWKDNDNWLNGNDWMPGKTPTDENWEVQVKLKGSTETIKEFGEMKKKEGMDQKYQDDFCKFWPKTEACQQLKDLNNDISVLEEGITDLSAKIERIKPKYNVLNAKNAELINISQERIKTKDLLNDDLKLLRLRPKLCSPCEPCKICKKCPSKEMYKKAKGICPSCSCTKLISKANELEINKCKAHISEKTSEFERRNIEDIKKMEEDDKKALDDISKIIDNLNDELFKIETEEHVCKKEKGISSTKKKSFNDEYMEMVKENQRLQKEYTDEKDKSWIEKLLS